MQDNSLHHIDALIPLLPVSPVKLHLCTLQATDLIASKTLIHAHFQATAITLGVNAKSAMFIPLIVLDADLLDKATPKVATFQTSLKVKTHNNLMSLKNKNMNKTNNNLCLLMKATSLNLSMTLKQLFSLTCPAKRRLGMKQMMPLQAKTPIPSFPLLRVLCKKCHC